MYRHAGSGAAAVLLIVVGIADGWFSTSADAAPPDPATEAAAPAIEAAPDLSGTWISDAGEVFQLTAQGSEYRVDVSLDSKPIGGGTARLTGDKLTVVTTEHDEPNSKPDTYICELTMANNFANFSGQCESDQTKIDFTLKR